MLFCAGWMTVAVVSPFLSSQIVDIVAVPEYAPCFVAGILMYVIYRFGPSPMLFGMLGFTYLMNLRHVTVRVKEVQPGFAVPTWPCIVVITLAYLVLLAVALHRLDAIQWRWLTVAGAITYPLYLLHQRIGYIVMQYLYQWTAAPVWLLIVVTLGGMSLLSWIVYRTIEVPLRHRLRQRSGALR